MCVNWSNPYEQRAGEWMRGNLHAHTTPHSPCASIPGEDLCRVYQQCGLHFLSLSEHMTVTAPSWNGLTIIPGVEWNSRTTYLPNRALTYQHHIGVHALDIAVLDAAVRCMAPEVMTREVGGADSLLVANHPNWLLQEHYDQYTLHLLAPRLDGVEIYNALQEWDEGEADATNRWDRLLSTGAPLLGFAGDDSHAEAEAGKAWITVCSEESSPQGIFRAIKTGNFYCSTGGRFEDIGREGDTVFASLREESRIRVIGDGGRMLLQYVGTEVHWSFDSDRTSYVRIHATNRNWEQAWSQPFFRTAPNGS